MGNSTKELVNAFNLNNYFSDKINTNFIVEDKKIFGLFASSTNIGEYLQRIGEKIIKRHYLSRTEVASRYYNLNYFPFVLGANPDKEYLGNGIVKVKLADSTNNEVIRNLKVHFANEFEKTVISKVVARLQKEAGRTKEEAYEWIRGTVQTGAIGSPYLYCIAFSNEYLEKRYYPKIFGLFKSFYISEFNSRLEVCGLKSSDFYEYRDDVLYIKDVSDKVVKSVAEYVKEEVALDFRTPGKEDSKVENFKDVLSSLMSKQVRKSINVYDYDTFTDENEKNGHNFALIPFIEMDDGKFETLSFNDARNIYRTFNEKINKAVPNGFIPKNYDIISDIRGKTANPQFANCKEPVYAFSNQQIALLLPMIMRSPIAYNEENKGFEFAVDLGNFKRRGSGRSSSKESTPTHLQNGGLPNGHLSEAQLESPTQSQGGVKDSPRQGSEKGLLGLVQKQLNVAVAVAGPSSAPSAGFLSLQQSGPSSSRGTQAGSEKEEKLSKALLYWFNLNNYALDPPNTNFIVKNGKIASLIDDSVNVTEYLQEVIDKTKEEYRVNEEEGYDLNEFPFQFLSNCEKNQETTVVANISRGALLNLKKLFSREHEGKVEIKDIDINIVEKVVRSKKNEWVDSQVREYRVSPDTALKNCYPDESALESISIIEEKDGYYLDRSFSAREVKLFLKERRCAKGTRNTTTTFKKIEESKKDDSSSGYSSGLVTDTENVSSKAEATTSSGYESMDCDNTGGGSQKRKFSSSKDEGSPTSKSQKSESGSSSSEEAGDSPRSHFSDSDSERLCKELHKTGISKW